MGRAAPQQRPHRGFLRRLIRRLFLTGFVMLILLTGAAYVYIRFAPVPEDRLPVQTSFVFDRNGTRIASLSGGENREVVPLAEIPPIVRAAVIAAEDRRFYKHGGLDPIGIGRAFYQVVRHSGRQGGSTITQQYVKNVYVGSDRTLLRKLKEAAVSVKLEQKLTKDQILERYLNTIYFGRGTYGVQAASRAYFRAELSDIDLPRAAYLAALIRSPENTDATLDPDVALRRRNSVLEAMVDGGSVTRDQADTAKNSELVGPNGVRARTKKRTVYNVADVGVEWYVDGVRRELIERYGEQAVLTLGLRVTTSLDIPTQRRAFRSAYRELLPSDSDPSAAVVVLDHEGRVRALVGGRSWDDSKVNLALGVRGGGKGRPAGSTFKPFVLAAMLRAGYSLESAFPGPSTLTIPSADGGADWNVRNTRGESFRLLSVIEATIKSTNTVFAQVATSPEIGADRIADAATDMGVGSDLARYPSIALGTSDVSPIEMADAYLTLASRGERRQPTFLVSVTTADGRSLSIDRPDPVRVMPESDADAITAVLERSVREGTGAAASIGGRRVAGKTGTTNDYRDAWFVGYTPTDCCVAAVWMGYPSAQQAMTNVRGIKVSGGTLPARLFSATLTGATPASAKFVRVTKFGGKLLPGADRRKAPRSESGSGSSGSSGGATNSVAKEAADSTPASVAAGAVAVETVETVETIQDGGATVDVEPSGDTAAPAIVVVATAPTVPPVPPVPVAAPA